MYAFYSFVSIDYDAVIIINIIPVAMLEYLDTPPKKCELVMYDPILE